MDGNGKAKFMITYQPKSINFKYILLLGFIHLTIYLAAVAVAYKLIVIGKILEPGPPFIFPITYALGDVIAEVYGYRIIRNIVWLSLFCEILYALMITFVVHLSPAPFWHNQSAYNAVFGNTLRFVVSGFFAVSGSAFINAFLFSKLKILMHGKFFWIRSALSSSVGGFFLVAITMALGYAGTISFVQLLKMFFSVYGLELIYALILAFPAWWLSGYLKVQEKIDVYDTNTKFNPFSLK